MHLVNLAHRATPAPLIVIPAHAGIQLHALRRFKLDPGLRRGDEGGDGRIKSANDAPGRALSEESVAR